MAEQSEIIFVVEDDPDGGFTARALGQSIYTEAETIDELKDSIRGALRAHFDDESEIPPVVCTRMSMPTP